LDSAAALTPGSGRIDLLGYATLERVGAALEYEQRFRSSDLSTFAQAWAGASRESRWKRDAGVMGGLRWRF
jgi:hypothetical protein